MGRNDGCFAQAVIEAVNEIRIAFWQFGEGSWILNADLDRDLDIEKR